MDSAIDYLKQISVIINTVDSEYKAFSKQLSLIDLETQDILHIIENENFNAVQGFQLAKQLKEVRVRRRAIKQNLELFQILMSYLNIIDLEKIKKKLNIKIKLNDELTYKPRVLSKAE